MPKETRRGRGEGTIYQKADGGWIGQITIGKKPNGTPDKKCFSGKSQKETIAKMKEFQYKLERGELPRTDKTLLGQWMTTWLETYKKPNVRQTTYENYQTIIDAHIANGPLSAIPVQKLTTHQIQYFLATKFEKGKVTTVKEKVIEEGRTVIKEKTVEGPLSFQMVNTIHHLIQAALEQALKNNMVARNVAKQCERFKGEKRDIKALTGEDVAALMAVIRPHRLAAAFFLDLSTGLRRGELLALKWENIDLDAGSISVLENLVRVKGGSMVNKPKTKSSIRTIMLPEKVIVALKDHKRKQELEKRADKSYEDNGLVFAQMNGKYIQPRNFQRTFEGWVSKTNLPKGTRFHDLRHTFVSNGAAAGIDIKTMQSITGHSDTRILLETYTHVQTESQKRAANTINDLLPDF